MKAVIDAALKVFATESGLGAWPDRPLHKKVHFCLTSDFGDGSSLMHIAQVLHLHECQIMDDDFYAVYNILYKHGSTPWPRYTRA